MLQRLGIHHDGGIDKSAPLASLPATIKRTVAARGKDCLARSFIVLPEAFNRKGPYERATDCEFESDVRAQLRALANQYYAAFVVGLVDNDADINQLPYSSAYLVTDSCCRRISVKSGGDSLLNNLYRTCDSNVTACDSPALHEEFCVAALICMDADDSERRESLKKCIEEFKDLGSKPVILCVPMKTVRYCTEAFASDFPTFHFALSNSCPRDYSAKYPSIIRTIGAEQIAIRESDCVLELADLR
jgi:hypothetical protein